MGVSLIKSTFTSMHFLKNKKLNQRPSPDNVTTFRSPPLFHANKESETILVALGLNLIGIVRLSNAFNSNFKPFKPFRIWNGLSFLLIARTTGHVSFDAFVITIFLVTKLPIRTRLKSTVLLSIFKGMVTHFFSGLLTNIYAVTQLSLTFFCFRRTFFRFLPGFDPSDCLAFARLLAICVINGERLFFRPHVFREYPPIAILVCTGNFNCAELEVRIKNALE